MNEKDFFKLLGYVKISKYRTLTLKSIKNTEKMPSEIAAANNAGNSQISAALNDLKKKNLVICVNEDLRKGRLYKCTELGLEILKKI